MNKSKFIIEQCIATDRYNLLRDGMNPIKYYFKKLYLRRKCKLKYGSELRRY